MREIIDYIKGMLSSDQPQSFARGVCAFIIYFLVCGFCYVTSKTGAMADLPGSWIALVTLLYGSSKAGDVITAIKGADNAIDTPPAT